MPSGADLVMRTPPSFVMWHKESQASPLTCRPAPLHLFPVHPLFPTLPGSKTIPLCPLGPCVHSSIYRHPCSTACVPGIVLDE